MGAASGDVSKFDVRFYDEGAERWISLAGEVDPFSRLRRVTARVTHLSLYGVFVEVQPPGAPDGGDAARGAWVPAAMSMLGTAMIVFGLFVRRRATITA